MATAYSDFDVFVIVRERGGQWTQFRRTPELDEIVCTLADLADTSQTAQRYAFRGAQVLLDHLGGQIGELVEAQATPTEARVQDAAESFLASLEHTAQPHGSHTLGELRGEGR